LMMLSLLPHTPVRSKTVCPVPPSHLKPTDCRTYIRYSDNRRYIAQPNTGPRLTGPRSAKYCSLVPGTPKTCHVVSWRVISERETARAHKSADPTRTTAPRGWIYYY
jgi:hypothetical protein